eukprot:364633-Chlamydomonas_euryale.AAC.5
MSGTFIRSSKGRERRKTFSSLQTPPSVHTPTSSVAQGHNGLARDSEAGPFLFHFLKPQSRVHPAHEHILYPSGAQAAVAKRATCSLSDASSAAATGLMLPGELSALIHTVHTELTPTVYLLILDTTVGAHGADREGDDGGGSAAARKRTARAIRKECKTVPQLIYQVRGQSDPEAMRCAET